MRKIEAKNGSYLVGGVPRNGVAIGFHGGATLRGSEWARRTLRLTDMSGWKVVYPDGLADPKNGMQTWNASHGCIGYAAEVDAPHDEFVLELVEREAGGMDSEVPLLFTGFSNGSAMAARAAYITRGRPNVALVCCSNAPSWIVSNEEAPELPPALFLHGAEDRLAPVEGGLAILDPPYRHQSLFEAARPWGGHIELAPCGHEYYATWPARIERFATYEAFSRMSSNDAQGVLSGPSVSR